MRADLELDVEDPGAVHAAVAPDLTDSDRLSFDTDVGDGRLRIRIEADSLGVLRGGTNTAMMLTKLSQRFIR